MESQPSSQPRAMKQLYALGEKKTIDLSLSENPLGCSPLVLHALKNLKLHFNDYPTPNGMLLKKRLAQAFGIDQNNLFVANGSESIINDIPKIFCSKDDEVIVPALSFPMFGICCELAGLKVTGTKMNDDLSIDLSGILKSISTRTSAIFICNPNNPTGSILSQKEILAFLRMVPKKVLVVVDEANIEFGGTSLIGGVGAQANLVVLRTFSKGFGLASLRIGFAVASKAIVQKLEEETPIFQISGLSEHLACVALEDVLFLQKTKEFVSNQCVFLKKELEKLAFTVFPSKANNLFVKIPVFLKKNQFVEQLERLSISVVAGSCFKGFDDSFFRISVRDEKTNHLFIEKMRELLSEVEWR